MTKETLTAKVSPVNLERLEEYAEREGISKSEATDRLVKQGLDVEESDMRLVPVQTDGGTIIEDRLDEIEHYQQNRLNEIEEQIESANKEKSTLKKWLEDVQFGAIAVTLASAIGYSLAVTNQVSISPNAALLSTGISTAIVTASLVIEDVVQNE